MSPTALHWLNGGELRAMYAELATVLGPGGLLLDGDHLKEDKAAVPGLARLGDAVSERAVLWQTDGEEGTREDWKAWWEAVTVTPELAGPAAERERRRLSEDHHGSESVLLTQHIAALRAAGFAEIGTLWQYGENRILCAIMPG